MVTASGWTYDEVGGHTLHEALELVRYWKRNPPAHVMLARLCSVVEALGGVKRSEPAAEPATKYATNDDVRELQRLFGQG